MTKDEILNMEAGQEIDNLVAEIVMGWHIEEDKFGWKSWVDNNGHYQHAVSSYDGYEDEEDFHTIKWHPSESILWAWEIFEKYDKYAFSLGRAWKINDPDWIGFSCWIAGVSAMAETAPLAVCRAMLLLIMEDEK